MCGIVAVFQRDGRPVAADDVVAMRDTLTHRGPDAAGVFAEGPVGLGHRRLRIIDLAGGHQPMANATGAVQLVFNGEIYNYRELRARLLARGYPLHTQSDTETILGLYDLYGDDCVDHLYGMFAFVLWDGARRRLLAARDRLGIKPLYVFSRGATLAFASEPKAFLALPGAEARLAEDAVPEYLVYRNLAGTRTMFRDVERLAPGELMVATRERVERLRYWTAPEPVAREQGPARSIDAWADELEALLGGVVREHLVSDVPLGTFNSGG
ncbi:MAG TPA: asparagine synthetase B, partial [Planctomycetota bacterium]|nr:asparagine synthetase B [Planctomycetota bacterium]